MTGVCLSVCKPGHDGEVVWLSTCRADTALLSIGGSSLKVWMPLDGDCPWWCVASTDLRCRVDTVRPTGLPPDDPLMRSSRQSNGRQSEAAQGGSGNDGEYGSAYDYFANDSVSVNAIGSSIVYDGSKTLAGDSEQSDNDCDNGQESRKTPAVRGGVGATTGPASGTVIGTGPATSSMLELPSLMMDELRSNSSDFDFDDNDDDAGAAMGTSGTSRSGYTTTAYTSRKGMHTARGVPPRFVPAKTPKASSGSSPGLETPLHSLPTEGVLPVYDTENGFTARAARKIGGIQWGSASTSVTCAAVIEVHGAHNVEGHHIVVGYGDGSLQLFSVFDWSFLYRISPSMVPFGRQRACAVTSLLQLPDKVGRLIVGYDDGCFAVWTRVAFGSFSCEKVVIAHSEVWCVSPADCGCSCI